MEEERKKPTHNAPVFEIKEMLSVRRVFVWICFTFHLRSFLSKYTQRCRSFYDIRQLEKPGSVFERHKNYTKRFAIHTYYFKFFFQTLYVSKRHSRKKKINRRRKDLRANVIEKSCDENIRETEHKIRDSRDDKYVYKDNIKTTPVHCIITAFCRCFCNVKGKWRMKIIVLNF